MQFGNAFSFVFQDQDWFKKVLIIGLVGLIPIIGQIIVLGWSLKITLNVIRNDPSPLPEMDFAADLARGFKAWVVSLVYALPMLVLYLPILILVSIVGNGDDTANVIVAIGSSCFGLLMAVYGVLMAFVLPAAYSRVAVEDSIGAGLAFGAVFGMVKKALVPYLLVLLGGLVAGFIAPLGTIACGIGVILTATYSMAILGHLYGQAYLEAKGLETI